MLHVRPQDLQGISEGSLPKFQSRLLFSRCIFNERVAAEEPRPHVVGAGWLDVRERAPDEAPNASSIDTPLARARWRQPWQGLVSGHRRECELERRSDVAIVESRIGMKIYNLPTHDPGDTRFRCWTPSSEAFKRPFDRFQVGDLLGNFSQVVNDPLPGDRGAVRERNAFGRKMSIFRIFSVADSATPSVGKSLDDLSPIVLKLGPNLNLNRDALREYDHMDGSIAVTRC